MSKLRAMIRQANLKKIALATGAVTTVMAFGAMSATAEETTLGAPESVPAAEQVEDIEEVHAVGIRGGLQKALDTKRDANSIVDAISAEDIGKFPDKNVAESLSRITGVSVTRGFGEGEKIAVRGTTPAQNRALLNGSAVASADWFALDQPGRSFNYTLLPSTIVSSLEVYKSPQAQIQEGSLGGTVNLVTRKPLDMDANSGVVSAQAQYSTSSEATDPLLSGLYSWKNDDETFGALVSLTKQDRTVKREGPETLGYANQNINGQDVWVPRAVGNSVFKQDRERETALVALQWRPDDKSEVMFNYLDSSVGMDNVNHNNYAWFNGQADGNTLDPTSITTSGSGVTSGTVNYDPTKNTAALNRDVYAEYYVLDRTAYTETDSLDLEYSRTFDSFNMTAKVGKTSAEGGTSRDRHYGFDRSLHSASFDADFNTEFYFDPALDKIADSSAYVPGIETEALLLTRGLGWMMENARIMNDDEAYANVDFEIPLDAGVFSGIKAGALYRDHDKSQSDQGTRFQFLSDDMHQAGTTAYGGNPGDDTTGWDRWLYGNLVAGTLGDYTYDDGAAYPLLDLNKAGSVIYAPDAYRNATTFALLASSWEINEKIMAAYVSGDFEGDKFRGNAGVRVVKTDLSSTGNKWNGDAGSAAIDQAYGAKYDLLEALFDPAFVNNYDLRKDTVKHSYTEVLPNVNVSYDMDEDTVLRASAARVMSRPDYTSISNSEQSNLDTATGSKGNPLLDPEMSTQFDVAYELYFEDGAMLSTTYFRKDITDSVLYTASQEIRQDNRGAAPTDVLVTFTTPTNGKGSEVQGLEIGYQQEFGDFGAVANYTFTDAKSREDRNAVANPGSGLVRGTSDHMINLTGYYENSMLSARASYNYRSDYYDGLDSFGSELYTKAFAQMDASVTWHASEDVDVVFEGVNLLGEKLEHYHIDKSRTSRIYDNGSRYVVGVNYSF